MNKAYLLIGGNEGDRTGQLEKARRAIEKKCGKLAAVSSCYETAAWGKTDQPAFLNQCILLYTLLEPLPLMQLLLSIEEEMGRKRQEKYGPRIIDIDILFFNNRIVNQFHLTIPHAEIQNRRFALVPMHELAPGYIHPVLKKSIHTLLLECKDILDVKKI